jgi:hypothetical protein
MNDEFEEQVCAGRMAAMIAADGAHGPYFAKRGEKK